MPETATVEAGRAETTSPFPEVRDYDPEQPSLPASLNKLLFGTLFTADFTFGLTSKPDSEGDVVKKTAYPGLTGRLYNRVYERLYEDVERAFGGEDRSEPTPVPSVDASSWDFERFAKWRTTANSPLVLKGLLKESRAVREWSKEWFVERYGDVQVRCLNPADEYLLEGDKSLVGENVRVYDMTLGDFLTEDRYERFYLNNFDGVLSDEDFVEFCDGYRIDELRGDRYGLTQWFIARSMRTYTPLHAANADNMFLNLKGRKEWHFFHPSLTPVLLPALSKFAVYAVSEIGRFGSDEYEDRYAAFPHLALLPKMSVLLEEGDVLYNPPWWWHNVQNRTPFTVGCATRYMAHGVNLRNAPHFHLCQFIDTVKHPTKSFLPRSLRARYLKGDRRSFIDSVFSRRDS